ncbi:MAG: YciI family protein [Arenicella sp.]
MKSMQFAITALDHKDSEALERRMSKRPQHVDGLKKLAKNNQLHSAGAILNDDGTMIGSSVHVSFESRDELDAWLKDEAYITGDVWNDIDIKQINMISIDALKE